MTSRPKYVDTPQAKRVEFAELTADDGLPAIGLTLTDKQGRGVLYAMGVAELNDFIDMLLEAAAKTFESLPRRPEDN